MAHNILFILTDQQRFDTIAAMGAPIIKTPSLDRLVQEGVTFNHCYTPSPVCVSARHSIITGLPPHVSGCVDNKAAKVDHINFIEQLSNSGYQTHGVGKMHFMPNPRDLRGFHTRDISEPFGNDDYKEFLRGKGFGHVHEPFGLRSEYYYIPQVSQLPSKLHNSMWVADKAIEFIRKPRSKPFFLWASFIKPHPPFESPTPWNKLYRTMEMPLPHRPDGYQEQLNFWNHVQNRYKYKDAGTDDLLIRTIRAAYYSSISFIDFNIGRILDALGKQIEETVIIFTSDHGEMLGDFGAFGKRCMLDPSVRVPLLTRWPNKQNAGKQINTAMSLVDLYPTFLKIAGCSPEFVHSESVSMQSIINGGDRDYVYSQFSENEWGTYMITNGHCKYCYCAADEKEWFYDLKSEEGESKNLIADPRYQDHVNRLRSRLIKRFQLSDYFDAVNNGAWRSYGRSKLPKEPADFGLLFQDPGGLQAKVDKLGDYARPILPKSAGQNILSGIKREN